MEHWFRLVLHNDIIRTLNKQQYKEAMHWLRQGRRVIKRQMLQEVNQDGT